MSPDGPAGPGTGTGTGTATGVDGGLLTTVGLSQAARARVATRAENKIECFMECPWLSCRRKDAGEGLDRQDRNLGGAVPCGSEQS